MGFFGAGRAGGQRKTIQPQNNAQHGRCDKENPRGHITFVKMGQPELNPSLQNIRDRYNQARSHNYKSNRNVYSF